MIPTFLNAMELLPTYYYFFSCTSSVFYSFFFFTHTQGASEWVRACWGRCCVCRGDDRALHPPPPRGRKDDDDGEDGYLANVRKERGSSWEKVEVCMCVCVQEN